MEAVRKLHIHTYIHTLTLLILLSSINVMGQEVIFPEPQTHYIKIDPKGTYLKTVNDPAIPASEFILQELYKDPYYPFKPGDILSFQVLGGFSYYGGLDDGLHYTTIGAVFRDYANLFLAPGSSLPYRAFNSLPTGDGGFSTNLDEDFQLNQGCNV